MIIGFFPDGPGSLWLVDQMRLPGRRPLAAFVVDVTATTLFCRDCHIHDIQIAASRVLGFDAQCPRAGTSMIAAICPHMR